MPKKSRSRQKVGLVVRDTRRGDYGPTKNPDDMRLARNRVGKGGIEGHIENTPQQQIAREFAFREMARQQRGEQNLTGRGRYNVAQPDIQPVLIPSEAHPQATLIGGFGLTGRTAQGSSDPASAYYQLQEEKKRSAKLQKELERERGRETTTTISGDEPELVDFTSLSAEEQAKVNPKTPFKVRRRIMVGGKIVDYDPEIHEVKFDPLKEQKDFFKRKGYTSEQIEIILNEPSFRLLKEEALRKQKPIAQSEWEKTNPKYKSLIRDPIPEILYVDKKFEVGDTLVFNKTAEEGVEETENKALVQYTGDKLRTTSEPISPPRHSLINKTHLPLAERNLLGKGQRLGSKKPKTIDIEKSGRAGDFKERGGLSVEDLIKMPMDARTTELLNELSKQERIILNWIVWKRLAAGSPTQADKDKYFELHPEQEIERNVDIKLKNELEAFIENKKSRPQPEPEPAEEGGNIQMNIEEIGSRRRPTNIRPEIQRTRRTPEATIEKSVSKRLDEITSKDIEDELKKINKSLWIRHTQQGLHYNDFTREELNDYERATQKARQIPSAWEKRRRPIVKQEGYKEYKPDLTDLEKKQVKALQQEDSERLLSKVREFHRGSKAARLLKEASEEEKQRLQDVSDRPELAEFRTDLSRAVKEVAKTEALSKKGVFKYTGKVSKQTSPLDPKRWGEERIAEAQSIAKAEARPKPSPAREFDETYFGPGDRYKDQEARKLAEKQQKQMKELQAIYQGSSEAGRRLFSKEILKKLEKTTPKEPRRREEEFEEFLAKQPKHKPLPPQPEPEPEPRRVITQAPHGFRPEKVAPLIKKQQEKQSRETGRGAVEGIIQGAFSKIDERKPSNVVFLEDHELPELEYELAPAVAQQQKSFGYRNHWKYLAGKALRKKPPPIPPNIKGRRLETEEEKQAKEEFLAGIEVIPPPIPPNIKGKRIKPIKVRVEELQKAGFDLKKDLTLPERDLGIVELNVGEIPRVAPRPQTESQRQQRASYQQFLERDRLQEPVPEGIQSGRAEPAREARAPRLGITSVIPRRVGRTIPNQRIVEPEPEPVWTPPRTLDLISSDEEENVKMKIQEEPPK